ncbi:MAG: DUF1054 domain-containing protein [Levilactobacillus sp.]|jgi:uncharacterized protein YktB (UPF0637 family)|uniref:DUF1054 family protein n=1 Tax=Levilactobacillus sp. TaxID=2767919 RepID=UPI002584814B|nr:DUF1054 family protein [Levilactobacillus sp.]MCH4124313.1 DUF1054 domain-containing protein [Levilactobacillus sp.]MCI1554254.1 DUF1054 domain-containing protein [Levilactobacillus sp.]MCI1598838.1 DUF1054 domain-containing protein [Levilactobacillus sp.]MCI1606898.1 DUF1054 domain-containing protein [Levilactobacillus sp.]
MYGEQDFRVWDDTTLPGRLGKIKAQIDPKFQATVTDLKPVFAKLAVPIYDHISQHRRRSKNPPPDTWVAFSTSKRGYKMLPHIEIGFWDDRFFIWLAVLQEAKNRQALLSSLPEDTVLQLPAGFECGGDHTDKNCGQPLTRATYQELMRQQPQRHAEWQVGRNFLRGSDFFTGTPAQQVQVIRETVTALLPLYDQLIRI